MRLLVPLLVVGSFGVAQAQEERRCVDGHVSDEPASLRPGRIVSKHARTHFHAGSDKSGECPGDVPVCREAAYVVRGDKVLVAAPRADRFVCAGFVSRKGNVTAGWLPADAVTVTLPAALSLSAWVGKWRYQNSSITIRRGKKPGTLSIEGNSWSKRYQSVNTGGFVGEDVMPTGTTLAFATKPQGEVLAIEKAEKTDCTLAFALVHDLMVVHDTGNCGGAGVYFTGFYWRRR